MIRSFLLVVAFVAFFGPVIESKSTKSPSSTEVSVEEFLGDKAPPKPERGVRIKRVGRECTTADGKQGTCQLAFPNTCQPIVNAVLSGDFNYVYQAAKPPCGYQFPLTLTVCCPSGN